MIDSQRYSQAFSLASELHAGDVRKGTQIPYISHLMAVSALVFEFGGNEDEAIAALLHDTAEDHGGEERLAQIETRFGRRVRDLVAACSDSLRPEGVAKEDWHARKTRYLAGLDQKDEGMLLVSIADKIHNARAIATDYRALGETFWQRFAPRTREDQLWYYRSLADAFKRLLPYSRATPALEQAVREIEAIARGEGWIRWTWLEQAIAEAEAYVAETRDGANLDRSFAAPGSDDYDDAVMERDDVDRAKVTLAQLKAERDELKRQRELR